jgi:FkbM family methyltransferase
VKLPDFIGKRLPVSVRRFARRFTPKGQLIRALSPYLPDIVCVDVGASYFPHTKWGLFLDSPRTHWIAIEPNRENLAYVDTWKWRSKVSTLNVGLSKEGGLKTLFITNVDSGSSFLEPIINATMSRRARNLDYFFPLRVTTVETQTLTDILNRVAGSAPVFIKLDTQGTELSILAGAENFLKNGRILGIEMESTLLARPIMQGAGKFWQACEYLENLGFEIIQISPLYGPSRFGAKRPKGLTYINECDSVFAVRPDIALEYSAECRVALIAFYLCNRLYEEALTQLSEDADTRTYLVSKGCSVDSLTSAIEAMR